MSFSVKAYFVMKPAHRRKLNPRKTCEAPNSYWVSVADYTLKLNPRLKSDSCTALERINGLMIMMKINTIIKYQICTTITQQQHFGLIPDIIYLEN